MKIIGLSLAAIAACCSIMSAHAQQEAQATGPADAPQTIESVTVKARRYHMEPQQFMYFEAGYRLSNGSAVTFSRRVGRFYVAIKDRPTVEIFPVTADQFVTRGGAKLIFTEGGDALDIDRYELLQAESGMPLAALSGVPK